MKYLYTCSHCSSLGTMYIINIEDDPVLFCPLCAERLEFNSIEQATIDPDDEDELIDELKKFESYIC